jgi:hypothetical protein
MPRSCCRRDGLAGQAELVLALAELGELVEHLALEALQVLQRDVEKVAAAAGGVEHAHAAQLVVKALQLGARLVELGLALPGVVQGLGLARQQQGGGACVGPVLAQRLDDGGQHQALDVGARRVVGAELVALGGVQRTLQQGAEDGRLDLAPVGSA